MFGIPPPDLLLLWDTTRKKLILESCCLVKNAWKKSSWKQNIRTYMCLTESLFRQNLLKVLILFPFELQRSVGIGLTENRIQPSTGRIQSHPVHTYISCIRSWLPKWPFAGCGLIPCFSITFLTKCSESLTFSVAATYNSSTAKYIFQQME